MLAVQDLSTVLCLLNKDGQWGIFHCSTANDHWAKLEARRRNMTLLAFPAFDPIKTQLRSCTLVFIRECAGYALCIYPNYVFSLEKTKQSWSIIIQASFLVQTLSRITAPWGWMINQQLWLGLFPPHVATRRNNKLNPGSQNNIWRAWQAGWILKLQHVALRSSIHSYIKTVNVKVQINKQYFNSVFTASFLCLFMSFYLSL